MTTKTIWTIGHSTLEWRAFLEMLTRNNIKTLFDVRTFPGSRRYAQFNRETMESALQQAGIDYRWMVDLGGRRKPTPNSINTAWKNDSFRGYADHMQTPAFKKALAALEETATSAPTAYMCSEAVWWRCHRGLISDALKAKGWEVLHISAAAVSAHPYTPVARVEGGQLTYSQERFL